MEDFYFIVVTIAFAVQAKTSIKEAVTNYSGGVLIYHFFIGVGVFIIFPPDINSWHFLYPFIFWALGLLGVLIAPTIRSIIKR